ncbi:beta-1,4-galactosyltransferase 3-like isoform X2 [Gouania willdenowi]|uniref:beta-1,4-galactosyltransferase 3-like isoform X2 n=1 Tax=Gouania willdenowi TaxID=441366 RepID=UPI0010542262|nr:beta-1,4-galactosyltransferase 3-like isoform X2 [Gouania willdenowi]
MFSFQSKKIYLFMFMGIQLVVIALLSREAYQKSVTYFIHILRKDKASIPTGRNQTSTAVVANGGDVYANLSRLSKAHSQGENLTYCPKTSPLIVGRINVRIHSNFTMQEVQRKNPLVVRGGRYRPPDCEARHRTAIIIPYRDREHHLKVLLYFLHPFLQRQQLNYGFYVIHQAGNYTFNRAKLMNVGFREAMKEEDWDCLFFHDVDLIPEDDRNTYVCDVNPKHVSVAIDRNNYKVSRAGMSISRPSLKVGRYKMINHTRDKGNDVNINRFNMLEKTHQTWKQDGMNTVESRVISREYHPLYTNITVDIDTKAGLPPPPPPPKATTMADQIQHHG